MVMVLAALEHMTWLGRRYGNALQGPLVKKPDSFLKYHYILAIPKEACL